MWTDIKASFRLPGSFIMALPLIVAVPVAIEAVQHVVEWKIGMFDSVAGAKAAESHPLRMGVGYIKTAALIFVAFWVWRFFSFGGDRARTLRLDALAIRLFAPVVLLQAALVVLQPLVGELLSKLFPAGGALILAGVGAMLIAMVMELYLAPWRVGAAVGSKAMMPAASIRTMSGNIVRSFTLTLLTFFTVMIPHYALNGFAIGQPREIVLAMLILDTLLVGYIAVLFPTVVYLVARRAAEKSETILLKNDLLLAQPREAIPVR